MSTVVVWSQDPCVQCNSTKRWLTKKGIAYTEMMLSDHPERLDEFKALGHMQAPVVLVEGQKPFSGFRPDLLEEYLVPREKPQDLAA